LCLAVHFACVVDESDSAFGVDCDVSEHEEEVGCFCVGVEFELCCVGHWVDDQEVDVVFDQGVCEPLLHVVEVFERDSCAV